MNFTCTQSSIARRVIFNIVLFSSFITLLITIVQLWHGYKTDLSLIDEELEQIEHVFLKSLSSGLWISNRQLLQTNINGILQMRDIQYVEIRDKEQLWAKAGIKVGENIISHQFNMVYPYRNKDINIGNLLIVVSLDGVYQRLLDQVWIVLISNALKTFIVVFFMYFLFYHLVVKHLLKIAQFANQDDLHLSPQILRLNRSQRKKDELDVVVDAINDMQHRLHEQIAEINQQKQFLSQTLFSIGDAVITTDILGQILFMNPVAEELTGWGLQEAKDQPLKTIFPIIDASTREPILTPVDKVIASGETIYLSNHTTLIARDGKEYQIADSAAPIRDTNDIIVGMVLVFNDVTENYLIREQLNNNLQRLSLHWKDTPLGIIEWNTDFEFIDINPAAEVMFGYSKNEIIGKSINDTIQPDFEQNNVHEILTSLLENTGGRRNINTNKTKNGRIILCDWYNTPLINEDGKVIGISCLVRDITEQDRLEKLDQDSKKQLQQLLNGMLTMIVTLSPAGVIIFANELPLRIINITIDDVMGKQFWKCPWFSSDKHEQSLIEQDCKRVAKGETINREMEIETLKGKLWVDYSLHPVFNEQGDIISLVAEGRDARKRKQAEEHAIRSQKMEALSKIVGGIAHDYNNMLGVITGYSGLLKRKYAGVEGAEKLLDQIIRAAERSNKLTRKMLNFSHPESSHAESCNINQALSGLYDLLTKSLTSVIQLKFNLTVTEWLAWIDKGELEDAILNMSINAKHAMPVGGILSISTENIHLAENEAKQLNLAANDYIKLTITDTGTGIQQSIQDKIFDPFFSSKGKAGNGLGLSQVFAFMQRAGGAIKLHSQIGTGTQFSLYFPRFHTPIVKNKETIEAGKELQLVGSKTILIVDDEPALRYLAREILLDAGYKVLIAADGQEALDILPTQAIDLVLSDVIMPNMNGYQLAQYIKDNYSHIKIQLTSGFTGESHSVSSDIELKENLIFKPYDRVELLTKIHFLLDSTTKEVGK